MTPGADTMRAAVVTEASGPFRVETLRRPEPRTGEVLIEVAACGVCHSDLHIQTQAIRFPLPCVLGHEVSGIVREIGPGVDEVAPGDRVVGAFIMPCRACRFCRGGHEDLCERFFAHNRLNGTLYDGTTRLFRQDGSPIAMYSMGGLAEFAVMPVGALARVPDSVPLREAAVLGCAFLTAYGAARGTADVRADERVAVLGVGGVGLALVQVLAALGCETIVAIDVAPDKLEAARALGATATIDSRQVEPVAAALEATDGHGLDVVFEAIGRPETFRLATELVADGGRCCMVGLAATGVTGSVEITRLVRRKLRVLGSFGGRPGTDLPAVVDLAARGKIDLGAAVSRRFTLDEVDDAYAALAGGQIVGRAVIDMTDTRQVPR
jgi:succinate semialdehyde reductase (NADPH)